MSCRISAASFVAVNCAGVRAVERWSSSPRARSTLLAPIADLPCPDRTSRWAHVETTRTRRSQLSSLLPMAFAGSEQRCDKHRLCERDVVLAMREEIGLPTMRPPPTAPQTRARLLMLDLDLGEVLDLSAGRMLLPLRPTCYSQAFPQALKQAMKAILINCCGVSDGRDTGDGYRVVRFGERIDWGARDRHANQC